MTTNGRRPKVYDNILQCIGNTPLVKLNRIPKDYGLECEIYAKCEFLNPGGSIKDRIAHNMVVDSQKHGLVKPDTRFIEPTSGNTGIGVSLVSAVMGYDSTIVTPDKNSDEKMSTMRLLGSEIVQTPAIAGCSDPDGFVLVAQKLLKENPKAMSMDQYKNHVNVETHYKETAEEILEALGDVDMFVMGAGTGGTVSGIGRRLKEANPHCIIVAVDPKGSIIYGKGDPVLYFVEGIGGDFIPDVLDKSVIDKVVKSEDKASFKMSREIIRKEGLLCGGSSGAITHSAIKAAKELGLGRDKKVVVILPDGIRNYMTKFVCDQWMESHLFKKPPERSFEWWKKPLSCLKVNRCVPLINENKTCRDAYAAMGHHSSVVFVVSDVGDLRGVVTKDSLRTEATNPKKRVHTNIFDEVVVKHLMKTVHKISEDQNSTVGLASRILDITPFVVVVEARLNGNNNVAGFIPKGIITPEIVLDYIVSHQNF